MEKLTFTAPVSAKKDGLKMWALRLDDSHKEKLKDLENKLGKSKSDVVRHLLDEAHAQLVPRKNGAGSATARASAATKRKRDNIQMQIAELKKSASEQATIFSEKINGLKAELDALAEI